MCAEVLVPDRLASDYILGAYVVPRDVAEAVGQVEECIRDPQYT